jgi:hypothetical protein
MNIGASSKTNNRQGSPKGLAWNSYLAEPIEKSLFLKSVEKKMLRHGNMIWINRFMMGII